MPPGPLGYHIKFKNDRQSPKIKKSRKYRIFLYRWTPDIPLWRLLCYVLAESTVCSVAQLFFPASLRTTWPGELPLVMPSRAMDLRHVWYTQLGLIGVGGPHIKNDPSERPQTVYIEKYVIYGIFGFLDFGGHFLILYGIPEVQEAFKNLPGARGFALT